MRVWSAVRGAAWFLMVGVACVCAAEDVEVFGEVAKILRDDRETGDFFGASVCQDGGLLSIGAVRDGALGDDPGTVYVYEHDEGEGWIEVTELQAPDAAPFDYFSSALACDGDRLAVGAHGDDNVNGVDAGSVYVFERDPNRQWGLVAKLLPADGRAFQQFGAAVSLSGDRIAVGGDTADESGSVHIFEPLDGADWQETAILRAQSGEANDGFGFSVSLEGERLAVGASRDTNTNGSTAGSVYVFELTLEGTWEQQAKRIATDGEQDDQFGSTVSLDGDRLAVGSPMDDDQGIRTGSAYVFERSEDGDWSQSVKLLPPVGPEDHRFGHSLSLDGELLAVGQYTVQPGPGRAYLYERDANGAWRLGEEVEPLDGQSRNFLGRSVSLQGDRLAVGAEGDDNPLSAGAVYVYEPVLVSPSLSISGLCPGEVRIANSGMSPRNRIGLYRSHQTGQDAIEGGPCDGTESGLSSPMPLQFWLTNFDGEGVLTRVVNEGQCGQFVQVVDEGTCLTSQVVQIPLPQAHTAFEP